jgi:hypothetical protein
MRRNPLCLNAVGFNRGPESFRGVADFLNLTPNQSASLALCLVHSASRLKHTGLLGYTKGLFYQIGCNRKPVGLSDRLLEFACIFTIGGVS